MSGWHPWPGALITQPRLTGIVAKVPDFCWLAADSVNLTAILVEIETPAKSWQQETRPVAAAELTQAREQLVAWRAWFSEALNQASFLSDYLVPDDYRALRFRQHYVLIHGSREEYRGDRVRASQRAAGMAAPDETLMSFDRLPEIVAAKAAAYGCVKREAAGFTAVAVPPTWDPDALREEARRYTRGYEQAIQASKLTDAEKQRLLDLMSQDSEQPQPFRFQPPPRIADTPPS